MNENMRVNYYTPQLGLNILYSGIKFTLKDWVRLNVQHYPLQNNFSRQRLNHTCSVHHSVRARCRHKKPIYSWRGRCCTLSRTQSFSVYFLLELNMFQPKLFIFTSRCTDGCIPGYTGGACVYNCPDICTNATCEQFTRKCTIGCFGNTNRSSCDALVKIEGTFLSNND